MGPTANIKLSPTSCKIKRITIKIYNVYLSYYYPIYHLQLFTYVMIKAGKKKKTHTHTHSVEIIQAAGPDSYITQISVLSDKEFKRIVINMLKALMEK